MTTGPTNDRTDGADGADGTGGGELAAERLRQVLTQSADSLRLAEGSLGAVLERAHRRSAWSWGTPVLATAAAVLLVVGVGVYAGSRDNGSAQPGSHSPSGTSLPTGPNASTSQSADHPSDSAQAAAVVTLAVYYAGESNGQARLYREFHQVRTATPVQAAITESLSVRATDPDYVSLWPARTKLVSYSQSGDMARVELSDAPQTFPIAAFQQIVYTVTAADHTVHSVQISYGSITQDPMTRGAAVGTIAPVWLLTPAQGATVSSPVTLSGSAGTFEATVNWEVDRADGTPVHSGHTMTPLAFVMGPWSARVSLPPGRYVAKAFEISPKDGTWTWVDTKAFTVR